MGSMIHLRCGPFEIDWGKNSGHADHRPIFQPSDSRSRRITDDDDEIVEVVEVVRSLKEVLPRLRLLGVTPKLAAQTCVDSLVEHSYLHEGLAAPTPARLLDALAGLEVQDLNLDASEVGLLQINPNAIPDEALRGQVEAAVGYADSWHRLALLSLCRGGGELQVTWEVNDVLRGGWMEERWLREPLETAKQFLIVGEGTSDTAIIKSAISILCPQVADFFYFVDMDKGYPFTGSGNVENFCKGLVSIRLLNRVLVVLDNDVAGLSTHRGLQALGLPANIASMALPELRQFERFRTIGPSGEAMENINGRAVSTECFLDLRFGRRGLPRVRWSSYVKKAGEYQGALEAKDKYKNHFLKLVAKGKGPDSYDFNKLQALVDAILDQCAVLAANGRPAEA